MVEKVLSMKSNDLGTYYEFATDSKNWYWAKEEPCIELKDGGFLYFKDAKKISKYNINNGCFEGIGFVYEFKDGILETKVQIEKSSGQLIYEIKALKEFENGFKKINWPIGFEFSSPCEQAYSVINQGQGTLIPNTWEKDVEKLHFDGQLCSSAAYMPWFGQVDQGNGYIAIHDCPYDSGYKICHKAETKSTYLAFYELPSLGGLRTNRKSYVVFHTQCDYNDLCKTYRSYSKMSGLFTSLDEKNTKNPLVDKLIGSVLVHVGARTHVCENTDFYDAEHPENNDCLTTFEEIAGDIEDYHRLGVEKLYLHLDGWGNAGYDNQHPDVIPANQEAGGWDGLKKLSDTCQRLGYMFGLHDQYRDFYFDAPSFSKDEALMLEDGSIFEMCRWAGGRQSYLCASLALDYVRRNFTEVLNHGIHLEASYLDVFTCNEMDECFNPSHRMTRQQCKEYRERCFAYLNSLNILPSSEECSDWAMKELVFCHYGPYDFMLKDPKAERDGLPVPLFNLVYHDCMILPWPMEQHEEDYMLYALLNGGAAYLHKDGAYPNCDGAFEGKEQMMKEEIKRAETVAKFQEKVAKCEMVAHEFVDGDPKIQKTIFSNGMSVIVNFHDNSYRIEN